MTILSTATLQAVCHNLIEFGSWQRAAAACDPPVSESVCYYWLAQSKRAQKSNQTESPYLFEWMDETRWLHEHARRARALQIFGTEAEIREALRHGRRSVAYDPATNRPLLALADEFSHLSQAQFDLLIDPLSGAPYDPKERYQWNVDGTPKFQLRMEHLPASLAQAALRATNQIYRDSNNATLDVNHRGVMNIRIEPAPFVPRVAPPVDAEFREIERPDIASLRAQAARLLADPNRATARPSHPVDLGNDAVTVARAPRGTADVDDAPRAPREPQPVQARAPAPAPAEMDTTPKPAPTYQRRHSQWGADPAADPTRKGAICAKVA